MIRRAFTMRLKPDSLGAYKAHHDNIWPELVAEIERAGIASITTFQRELDLFLVSEIEDEAAWDKLWSSAIHRRWAHVMEPLMHLREDGIVDSGELTEVFHLTTSGHGNRQVALSAVAVSEPPSEANMQMNYESLADSGPAASSGLALDAPGNSAIGAEYDASPEAIAMPLPPDEPPIAPPNEPTPAPPNKPRRKSATRRGKKKATKKTVKKKAAKKKPAKKSKRPKARAAAKRTRKPAIKKGAAKNAKAKKKPAKKKKAARKIKQAVKKKAARRPAKKRRK